MLANAIVRRLYATASLIIRDAELAHDAVQETLIEVWKNLPGLREPAAFDGWVRKILVRRCYRAIRERHQRRMEVEVAEYDAPIASHEAGFGEYDQLERAFRRLSPEHRAVLVLHHRDGLEIAEAAQVLGIPIGTAKSRLNRATTSLRAAVAAEERLAGTYGRQTA